MLKKSYSLMVMMTVLAVTVGGCRSTQEYERLSRAGIAYVEVINGILQFRENLGIDQTSQTLLYEDQLPGNRTTLQDYLELSNQDRQRITLLENIRRHNQLLADYFTALGELATSDTPSATQATINDIVLNLNGLRDQLLPGVNESRLANRLSQLRLSRLIINSRIQGALRQELEQRQDYIRQELVLQQELLDVLASQIQDVYQQRVNQEEQDRVINPLLSNEPIRDPVEWVELRRQLLTQDTLPQQVRAARNAAIEFQRIFEGFVTGNIDSNRLDQFLTNVESLLADINRLRN